MNNGFPIKKTSILLKTKAATLDTSPVPVIQNSQFLKKNSSRFKILPFSTRGEEID